MIHKKASFWIAEVSKLIERAQHEMAREKWFHNDFSGKK